MIKGKEERKRNIKKPKIQARDRTLIHPSLSHYCINQTINQSIKQVAPLYSYSYPCPYPYISHTTSSIPHPSSLIPYPQTTNKTNTNPQNHNKKPDFSEPTLHLPSPISTPLPNIPLPHTLYLIRNNTAPGFEHLPRSRKHEVQYEVAKPGI